PFVGTHAGVATAVDRGSPDDQVLYDPGGSYHVPDKGSGDALYGPDVDLGDYIDYQRKDGPNVDVYRVATTPEEEAEIKKRIEEHGSSPLYCARDTSRVLDGIGPFKGLGRYWTPRGLGRALGGIGGGSGR